MSTPIKTPYIQADNTKMTNVKTSIVPTIAQKDLESKLEQYRLHEYISQLSKRADEYINSFSLHKFDNKGEVMKKLAQEDQNEINRQNYNNKNSLQEYKDVKKLQRQYASAQNFYSTLGSPNISPDPRQINKENYDLYADLLPKILDTPSTRLLQMAGTTLIPGSGIGSAVKQGVKTGFKTGTTLATKVGQAALQGAKQGAQHVSHHIPKVALATAFNIPSNIALAQSAASDVQQGNIPWQAIGGTAGPLLTLYGLSRLYRVKKYRDPELWKQASEAYPVKHIFSKNKGKRKVEYNTLVSESPQTIPVNTKILSIDRTSKILKKSSDAYEAVKAKSARDLMNKHKSEVFDKIADNASKAELETAFKAKYNIPEKTNLDEAIIKLRKGEYDESLLKHYKPTWDLPLEMIKGSKDKIRKAVQTQNTNRLLGLGFTTTGTALTIPSFIPFITETKKQEYKDPVSLYINSEDYRNSLKIEDVEDTASKQNKPIILRK